MTTKITKFSKNLGMMLVIDYLALLAVNFLVILLAHLWFPNYVVLGTVSLSVGWALCLSMGKLTLLTTFAIPFFYQWEINRGKTLADKQWIIGYYLINFVGLWLISRFSHIFGFGASSWVVIAILALALDMVQGLVMMKLENWSRS